MEVRYVPHVVSNSIENGELTSVLTMKWLKILAQLIANKPRPLRLLWLVVHFSKFMLSLSLFGLSVELLKKKSHFKVLLLGGRGGGRDWGPCAWVQFIEILSSILALDKPFNLCAATVPPVLWKWKLTLDLSALHGFLNEGKYCFPHFTDGLPTSQGCCGDQLNVHNTLQTLKSQKC